MKILTVLGARPQFIKAGAVSRVFQKQAGLEEVLVHTGQHYDKNMSDIFFEELEIQKPAYNLNINRLNHGAMTGKMLAGIEEICLEEKPDFLMIYGDTNSTLAGALAAKKLHIKVAHVEAGLRSFNMQMPEEVNRILTDRISNLLFTPSDAATQHLINEGYEQFDYAQIHQVGDVMKDAAWFYREKSKKTATVLSELNLKGPYAVATFHRAENTDVRDNLKSIAEALNTINETIEVVVPLHPRTKARLEKEAIKTNFRIIDPIGYLDMVQLVSNSNLVLTDSGGLQKEAYFFGKFCITMREQTEWVELVDHGVNILTGSDKAKILKAFEHFSNLPFDSVKSFYGNGDASDQICKIFCKQ